MYLNPPTWRGKVSEGFAYEDARIVLTGASSGIGADLAVRLARRGSRLLLVARRKDVLADVATQCNGRAEVHAADLTDTVQVDGLLARVEEDFGGADVLVNNAGAPCRVRADRLAYSDVETAVHLNYLTPVKLTLGLLPGMLGRGHGRLVFVSSVAGRLPAPRESAYVGSKFAMTGFAEVLAMDLQDTGIKVHVVCPGVIDTPLWDVPGQEAAAYKGKRTPASEVSAAILRLLDTGRFDAFVPGRFRWVWRLRPLLGERFLTQAARFDQKGAPQAWK
jgi:short-subunit dehydrogenase